MTELVAKEKTFGRAQKAILTCMAFAFTGSIIMCAVGLLSGDNWVNFNIAVLLGGIGALSGGKAAQTWAEKRNEVYYDVDEAP